MPCTCGNVQSPALPVQCRSEASRVPGYPGGELAGKFAPCPDRTHLLWSRLFQMGRYNRDFAKARLDKMDAQFGRDGRLLDASKAKKAYADGQQP